MTVFYPFIEFFFLSFLDVVYNVFVYVFFFLIFVFSFQFLVVCCMLWQFFSNSTNILQIFLVVSFLLFINCLNIIFNFKVNRFPYTHLVNFCCQITITFSKYYNISSTNYSTRSLGVLYVYIII